MSFFVFKTPNKSNKKQYKCEQNGEPKYFLDLVHQKRLITYNNVSSM
jgi:hypothetical protein